MLKLSCITQDIYIPIPTKNQLLKIIFSAVLCNIKHEIILYILKFFVHYHLSIVCMILSPNAYIS